MNCLQFFIFTRFFAVSCWDYRWRGKLWIAYNFLSLQGSLQFNDYANNTFNVVNCLQFFIFTRFFAVKEPKKGVQLQLWIAYNFLSLQGSLQWIVAIHCRATCCELLTIFYLYKVLCSKNFCYICEESVVNCLQFFIFTRFFAVEIITATNESLLWIAYNFLSLQGSLQ